MVYYYATSTIFTEQRNFKKSNLGIRRICLFLKDAMDLDR